MGDRVPGAAVEPRRPLVRESLRSEAAGRLVPPLGALSLPTFVAFVEDDPLWDACSRVGGGRVSLAGAAVFPLWNDDMVRNLTELVRGYELAGRGSGQARLCAGLAHRALTSIAGRRPRR